MLISNNGNMYMPHSLSIQDTDEYVYNIDSNKPLRHEKTKPTFDS